MVLACFLEVYWYQVVMRNIKEGGWLEINTSRFKKLAQDCIIIGSLISCPHQHRPCLQSAYCTHYVNIQGQPQLQGALTVVCLL